MGSLRSMRIACRVDFCSDLLELRGISVEWMAVNVNLLSVMGVVGYKVSSITTHEVLPVLVRKEGEFLVLCLLCAAACLLARCFLCTRDEESKQGLKEAVEFACIGCRSVVLHEF